MYKRLSFLLLLLCTSFLHSAPPITYGGVVYDDQTVAKLVTVITSTSPIPSIPSVEHIYDAQESLFRIPALRLCKKIIVCDAVPENKKDRAAAYEQYKKNLMALTQADPIFSNTELIFSPTWGHLSGTLKEAMKKVTTPFIFVHQHDLIIKKDFDLNRAVATLVANPRIKYIHFSTTVNSDTSWNGPVDGRVLGTHFVPLTRSFGWSDRTHLASSHYYRKTVLPRCDHCFMEDVMRPYVQNAIARYGRPAHGQLGVYLYGDLTDGAYIEHTDGRNN
jgi:hypothetical protein